MDVFKQCFFYNKFSGSNILFFSFSSIFCGVVPANYRSQISGDSAQISGKKPCHLIIRHDVGAWMSILSNMMQKAEGVLIFLGG